jgi:hypothetical protein
VRKGYRLRVKQVKAYVTLTEGEADEQLIVEVAGYICESVCEECFEWGWRQRAAKHSGRNGCACTFSVTRAAHLAESRREQCQSAAVVSSD